MYEDELDFDIVAEVFYETLFRDVPDVKPLFLDTGRATSMLITALQSIADMERGDPVLKDYMATLGDRHRLFGVTKSQMVMGQRAFENAIDKGGRNLSPQRRAHYLEAFAQIQKAMGFL